MNKMVYAVFKAIMMSMLFIFVWDMVFYLYRAISLNQRVENLMTSVQKVIMENNYLPQETAKMYQSLFYQMAADYNMEEGDSYSFTGNGTDFFAGNNNAFVLAMDWNYLDNAVLPDGRTGRDYLGVTSSNISVHDKMSEVGDYGDVTVVQFRVIVAQPMYEFVGNHQDAESWTRDSRGATTEFDFTYFVPNLKYKSITQ